MADFVELEYDRMGGQSWHGPSYYVSDGSGTLAVQFGEQVYACRIDPVQMQAVKAAITVLENRIKQLEKAIRDADHA